MNFQFSGAAQVCWIIGLLLIIVSALGSTFTGGGGGFWLVLIGALLIGLAFILRGRASNG